MRGPVGLLVKAMNRFLKGTAKGQLHSESAASQQAALFFSVGFDVQ